MNSHPVVSRAISKLTALLKEGKLSRLQTGLAALALLTVLYAVLWIVLDRPGSIALAQEPTTAATPAAQDTQTAAPAADGSLSTTFLGEYDRLSAGAATSDAENNQVAAAPGSTLNTIFFSLLFVAGIAYVGIWGYKQVALRKQGTPSALNGRRLSVQETQSLGPNQRLHLVRLGDEVLLLGATDHSITCLARYGTEYADDSFDAHLASATNPKPGTSSVTPSVMTPSVVPQPLTLQESLDSLRKVQHRPHGGEHA